MNGQTTRRELWSQPERWRDLISRVGEGNELPDLELSNYDEVIVFGSGTSYYLALLLAALLGQKGIRAKGVPSCELFLHTELYLSKPQKRLAIGISRSGESSEGLIAADLLKEKGIPLLALGCDADSSLPQKADYHLIVPEGHEDGLVMLRSFTCMLLGFQLFLEPQTDSFRTLPLVGKRLLSDHANGLKALANQRNFNRFVILGSGLNYPLAVEASLKFQEMAISTSEAYHSLEYRHGPKSTADTDTLVVLFALERNPAYGVKLIDDLKDYGVSSLVVGENVRAYEAHADYTIGLESGLTAGDRLVLNLLPVQVLAFETALRLNQNPDAPRNLSAVVKF